MIWDLLDKIGSVLFLLDAVGMTVFVALYALRSQWRATEAGRLLLRFMAIVAAILVAAVVLGLIGNGAADYARVVLRVVLYGLLLAGIVHLIVLLLRSQRRDRAAERGRLEEES